MTGRPPGIMLRCLALPALAAAGPGQQHPLPEGSFVNPICAGADPFVVRHGDRYVWCFSERNLGIAVHVSRSLTDPGEKHVVFEAPSGGPASSGLWAPEIHLLDGRWHVYFAATDGPNRNHRAFVLRSAADDPLGAYTLHGPLYTGDDPAMRDDNRWAIDMTVLEHQDRRYAIWSGWNGADDDLQYLFAAPMRNPIELAGPRVRIANHADHDWERTEERAGSRGLNEAPQVLRHRGRTFLTYSCGASWLPTYKIGLLELTGSDPLDPAAWRKHPAPVFASTAATFGVGHASFTTSPDGAEHWLVYHAKCDAAPGWRRAVFAQPFSFREDGTPDFGRPVRAGVPLAVPAGQRP